MTFSYVDLNLISDKEYKYLLSINKWLNKDTLTQVYVVEEHGDTKTQLCFGTKEKDRDKGYCSFGLYMLLEVIKTNPSIEEVLLVSTNKIIDILCQNFGIPTICDNILYLFVNPNFNPQYKELEMLVRKGTSLEELIDFCSNDETMLQIIDIWLDKRRNESLKLKYR